MMAKNGMVIYWRYTLATKVVLWLASIIKPKDTAPWVRLAANCSKISFDKKRWKRMNPVNIKLWPQGIEPHLHPEGDG